MNVNQGLLLEKCHYMDVAYTITLAPGAVRYLKIADFLEGDVEQWIDLMRGLSPQPQVKSPSHEFHTTGFPSCDHRGLNLEEVDELAPD